MKKSLKILLSTLCLFPILIFSGCKSPSEYTISARPSDSFLGSIPEVSNLNLSAKKEGSKITLNVKENFPDTNPFICWVKDYKKVVSVEKTLSLTYSENTAGNYTAVFHEISQSNMMFASVDSLSFIPETENYVSVNYEMMYARDISGSTNFSSLENGSFNIEENYKTNNSSIVYFGSAGDNYRYNIRVHIELTSRDNTLTTFYIDFTEDVNKSIFDSNGVASISESYGEIGILNITFKKLNSSMFVENS